MPTFYAQKTTVQLSVANLERATTLDPRTQQSLVASKSIRNITQEFAKGSKDGTLTETPFYTEEGSHVRFLGKHGTMPFFMVHAGKNFFDLTTKEKRNRRPARVPLAGKGEGESASTGVGLDKENIDTGTSKSVNIEFNPNYEQAFVPHALCLTVFLSSSSFVHSKNRATMRTEMNDVKIDVYFNGALCGSHYVPRRYSGEMFSMTEHIVRFTGRRIGRLIEKPWVLIPSGQNPDGSLREYRRGKVAYAGAQQRWSDVSDVLMAEADKMGQDTWGERPVIGEYLESLAQLSMPREVEDMQKAGSPKFGILDAVVIWGKGNKNGPEAPYILEPTPIRNEGFTIIDLDQLLDYSPVQNVTTTTDTMHRAPRLRSEALANAKPIRDCSDASPPSVRPSSIPTRKHETAPAAWSPPNKRRVPALSFETPARQTHGHGSEIATTKQTLSDEVSSRATASDPRADHAPIVTRPGNARAGHAPTGSSSPLSSAPTTGDHTPARRKIVKLKLPSPGDPSSSPGGIRAPGFPDGQAGSDLPTPSREQTAKRGPKRRERTPTMARVEALDRGFVTPALSADCSVTYAKGGVVRNVGAARGGVFREGGVIMGARFIVGG